MTNEMIPVGIGKRPDNDWEEIPIHEVENTVAWVNPHIEAPFEVVKGQPTKLGVFVSKFESAQRRNINVQKGHGRTGILGQVIFKDDAGRIYRDVDLKGIGHVAAGPEGMQATPIYQRSNKEAGFQGIFEYADAMEDALNAEKLVAKGIRTYRIIAIIKLKQVIPDGQTIMSIEQAKSEGRLPQDSEPVVSIRAFGTRTRIADVLTGVEDPKSTFELEDAERMIAQELNRPDLLEEGNYMAWFANTLAENVARLHKNAISHGFLTDHNITLDCRIVDLDSVEEVSPEHSNVYNKELKTTIDEIKTINTFYEFQWYAMRNIGSKFPKSGPIVNDLSCALSSLERLNDRLKYDPPKLNVFKRFMEKYFQTLEKQ